MKKLIIILITLCLLSPCFAAEKTFYTLGDESISFEKLISHPNTILFVWATWCPSCRRELKSLSQKRIFFENVNVWYVSTGEKESVVRRYADAKKMASTVRNRIILDTDGYIAEKLLVSAIPTFIFFKDGQPIYKSYFLDNELLEKVFGEE